MNEVLQSVRRTPYQSLAAFLVLFFTIFLSTALFVVLSFLFGFLGYVETRPQVVIFFQSKTSETDILKLKNSLQNTGKITSIEYVSKQQAYEIYKDSTKDNPLFLEMTPKDLLPASLKINAKNPNDLPEIAKVLEKQPGVDEVIFNQDIYENLLALTATIRQISFVLFSYLIFMAVVVFVTIILFKIALKKEEIEVLRLLGASNFYIRKPFLKEGVFFGLTTACLSFALILSSVFYFRDVIAEYFKGITVLTLHLSSYSFVVWPLSINYIILTFGLSCIFGMFIALIASYLATTKYLS